MDKTFTEQAGAEATIKACCFRTRRTAIAYILMRFNAFGKKVERQDGVIKGEREREVKIEMNGWRGEMYHSKRKSKRHPG